MPVFMLFGSRRFLDCETPLYGFFMFFGGAEGSKCVHF